MIKAIGRTWKTAVMPVPAFSLFHPECFTFPTNYLKHLTLLGTSWVSYREQSTEYQLYKVEDSEDIAVWATCDHCGKPFSRRLSVVRKQEMNMEQRLTSQIVFSLKAELQETKERAASLEQKLINAVNERETLKEQLRQSHVVIQALNERLALKS